MFLLHNKTYTVNSSPGEVQARLKTITTRRWEDLAIDIIGSVRQDGSFRLTSKQGMDSITWMENRPAYMHGRILPQENRSCIRVRIRPNLLLLFLSIATLLLLLLESLNLSFWPGVSRQLKLILLTAISLLLTALNFWCMNELKNKFERLMNLREAISH